MTTTPSRAMVRALLESHVQRHAEACLQGRGNAVKLDLDDELNDAYRFIFERHGHLAAETFKRMYVEEELAFMLDLQANPAAVRQRVLPNQPPPVVVKSHLAPPRKSAACPLIATLAALFLFGLLIGLSRH